MQQYVDDFSLWMADEYPDLTMDTTILKSGIVRIKVRATAFDTETGTKIEKWWVSQKFDVTRSGFSNSLEETEMFDAIQLDSTIQLDSIIPEPTTLAQRKKEVSRIHTMPLEVKDDIMPFKPVHPTAYLTWTGLVGLILVFLLVVYLGLVYTQKTWYITRPVFWSLISKPQ